MGEEEKLAVLLEDNDFPTRDDRERGTYDCSSQAASEDKRMRFGGE